MFADDVPQASEDAVLDLAYCESADVCTDVYTDMCTNMCTGMCTDHRGMGVTALRRKEKARPCVFAMPDASLNRAKKQVCRVGPGDELAAA